MGEGPITVRVRHRRARYYAAIATAVVLGTGAAVATTVTGANSGAEHRGLSDRRGDRPRLSSWSILPKTSTPIKHVVVLFDENESFDHYFGTYPYAANTDGSTFESQARHPEGERPVQLGHLEGTGLPAADQ